MVKPKTVFSVKNDHFWSQNGIQGPQNDLFQVKMDRFWLKCHPIKEHGDSVFGNDPILVKELKETIANQRVNQPIIAVKTYNET